MHLQYRLNKQEGSLLMNNVYLIFVSAFMITFVSNARVCYSYDTNSDMNAVSKVEAITNGSCSTEFYEWLSDFPEELRFHILAQYITNIECNFTIENGRVHYPSEMLVLFNPIVESWIKDEQWACEYIAFVQREPFFSLYMIYILPKRDEFYVFFSPHPNEPELTPYHLANFVGAYAIDSSNFLFFDSVSMDLYLMEHSPLQKGAWHEHAYDWLAYRSIRGESNE